MKTAKEVQDKILAIEERLQNIECSDGLKAADIISLSRQIDALKAEISLLQPPSRTPPPPFSRYRPVATSPKRPPGLKIRLTEGNIGRYGIGILASLLVLLAVGTIAGTFWGYIPDELKYLCILAVGAVCELFGWKKLRKSGMANGFWTSVAGLGAAICFAVFVFGQVIWGLYPSSLTAGMLLSWFAINFALATGINSEVFYAITYIGGYISTYLIFAEGGMSVTTEVLIAAALLVIYLIGKFGFRISGNPALPVFNMLFCMVEFLQIRGEIFIPYFDMETLCAPYHYRILPCFLVILAVLILLDMANVWRENWRYSNLMNVVLPGIGSLIIAHACIDSTHTVLSGLAASQTDMWSWIWILTAIVGCGIAYRNKLGKYILGVSPVVTSILVLMSESLFGSAIILSTLLSSGLLFIPIVRRDKYGRAAGMVVYLITFAHASTGMLPEGKIFTFLLWLQTILLISIPVLNYIFDRRQRDGLFPELEALVGFSCASFAIHPLAEYLGVSDSLWVLALAVFALIYRYFMPNKPVSENLWEREIARVALVAIHVFVCICAFLGGLIMPDTADKVVSTIILTAYSMASVYKSVNERRAIYSIISALFCNLNISFLLSMWRSNSANVLISCAGLALSAAFIAIGFWQKKRNIRITGLVAVIGYVLKIALFDVREFAGSSSQVLALLAGGLICFAVSFAYNRLNKLCGDDALLKEESERIDESKSDFPGRKHIRRWHL